MKDCFYQYRKGVFESLSTLTYKGNPIPVMEYPDDDQVTPYIQLLNMSSVFERDDDEFTQMLTMDIMVVTSHMGKPGIFGSKESDDIMNLVMQKMITKGVTIADKAAFITMDDFTDAGCYFVSLNYIPEWDGTVTRIRKILTIQTIIDEN